MFTLNEFGFDQDDIKLMLELNPELEEISNDEIQNHINILKAIGCNTNNIIDIAVANPFYLTNLEEDIIELIAKLKSLGFTYLNLLFDSNPFLLNKEAFEIDDYIKQEIKKGKLLEDIVDDFEANPYLIDEE